MPSYWLLKTEPSTYSFDQLQAERQTLWNGIRNYQARNYLRDFKKGDFALIYHSGKEKAVVGIAKVLDQAIHEPDPDGGDWLQVKIASHRKFKKPVPLQNIKTLPELKNLPLLKQSRLSVMPIGEKEFNILTQTLGEVCD